MAGKSAVYLAQKKERAGDIRTACKLNALGAFYCQMAFMLAQIQLRQTNGTYEGMYNHLAERFRIDNSYRDHSLKKSQTF